MLDFLERAGNGIAGFFTGAATAVGKWIKDAILAVFHFFLSIVDHVGGAWDWMVNGVEWFGTQVGDWAGEAYKVLAHLLGVVVPNAIAKAISDSVRWATGAIDWLHKHVIHPIAVFAHNALRWAERAVHDVRSFIEGVWREVKRIAAFVWHEVTKAVDIVLHPKKLLHWIVHGLDVALVWTLAHLLLPVFVAILKASATLFHEVAVLTEDALSELL